MTIGAIAYSFDATYWGAPVQTGFGGYSFAAPVLLKCRWEDRTEKFMDSQGAETVSSAQVWTFDRLEDGGYLAKGDRTATADPTTLQDAYEIRRSDEIPDLRGLHYERRAFL